LDEVSEEEVSTIIGKLKGQFDIEGLFDFTSTGAFNFLAGKGLSNFTDEELKETYNFL
jgi:hypothetical protein